MKKHYNIFELESKLDTKIIKQTVTMRLDRDSVKYWNVGWGRAVLKSQVPS